MYTHIGDRASFPGKMFIEIMILFLKLKLGTNELNFDLNLIFYQKYLRLQVRTLMLSSYVYNFDLTSLRAAVFTSLRFLISRT